MVFPNLPGHTLQESLDELMQLQMLSPALALRYFKPCQQKTHTMQGLQYIPPSLPCSVPFSHSVIFNTIQVSENELQCRRVLIQFDKSINNALATRVKTKLHFKVSSKLLPLDCVQKYFY